MQRCSRCGGILLSDVLDEVGISFQTWHCVICGNWIDSLIRHHQTVTVLPDPGSNARTTIFNGTKGRSLTYRRFQRETSSPTASPALSLAPGTHKPSAKGVHEPRALLCRL